jgi:hypothetical protein
MLKKTIGFACVAACLGTFGEPTMGEADGKYVIDVPAGETYALTADDVTAIGALPLVKAGEGTLTVNDVLANYNGDIYITNGFYRATTSGAVGTTNGVTYVLDGGTFNSTVYAGTSGGQGFATGEKFYVCGNGYNNKGAIRQTDSSCAYFGGTVTFTGPTRIAITFRFDFRYGTLDMGGHTMTVACENNQMLYLVAVTIRNPGNIVVESGGLEFQSADNGLTTAQTVTMKSGTYLSQWNSTSWQNVNLVLENNVRLISASGTYEPGKCSQNVWQGPISVQGRTQNDLSSGKQVMLYGKVSGAGGFWGGNGGWLQFYNASNTFMGGITQKGGGVAAWGANSIPVQGGALALTNASIHMMATPLDTTAAPTMTFPDVAIDGAGAISGRVVFASAKSLAKTGAGVLDIWTPLRVKGALDVRAGGVRIHSHIPDAPSGLKWWYKKVSKSYGVNTVPSDVPYYGVDQTGVSYAYRSWPSGIEHTFYYSGYIRIPGEEGEEVTCNFASCIWRATHLRIGNKDVIKFSDQTDELTGKKISGWTRFYMGPQVTLTAGWQPFFLVMGNWYQANGGPGTVSGWASNFGIGVDWQARCVTNSTNYAKLVDPGDGSFLRSAMDKAEAAADADAYRPVFDGPATFGPGTSIDFGDAAPYVPFVFNGLSGCPAITNGELVVSNTWTVAHAQAAAQPLTVAAGAKLTFAAGTTLAIADIDLFSRRADGTTLVRAAEANAITGLPTLMGGRGWKLVASEDGKTLTLRDVSGSVLFVR